MPGRGADGAGRDAPTAKRLIAIGLGRFSPAPVGSAADPL